VRSKHYYYYRCRMALLRETAVARITAADHRAFPSKQCVRRHVRLVIQPAPHDRGVREHIRPATALWPTGVGGGVTPGTQIQRLGRTEIGP